MTTTAVKTKLPASFDPSIIKVVIFNGPPGSGKDEAAKFVERNAGFATELVAFKKKLTELTCMIYGVDPYLWADRYDDHKEEPWDQLGGLSQRRTLQIVSEDVIKPVYGNDYFGKATLKDIVNLIENGGVRVAISDCGFKEELNTLLTYFKPEELLLVRTHRPGHSFEGDTRSYLQSDTIASIDLINDTTLKNYHRRITEHLGAIFHIESSDDVDLMLDLQHAIVRMND